MLTVIMGPMKSGKSQELLSHVSPYSFAKKKTLLVQSVRNVRDDKIKSRNGLSADAKKIGMLSEAKDFDVIGVDEIHMFDSSDVQTIEGWLATGKTVVLSGIDTDHQGKLMPIFVEIMGLKPDVIISKLAVCDVCQEYKAKYTQVMKEGAPVSGDLPPVIPDTGEYQYEVRCRKCFIKPKVTTRRS